MDFGQYIEKIHSKLFRCKICDRHYVVKNSVYAHVRGEHYSRKFTCHFCGHESKYKHDLIKHLQTAHQKTLFDNTDQENPANIYSKISWS